MKVLPILLLLLAVGCGPTQADRIIRERWIEQETKIRRECKALGGKMILKPTGPGANWEIRECIVQP